MKLSPRTLSVAGIAFVLLAILFVFQKEKRELFSETEEDSPRTQTRRGSDTRKHDSREDSKHSREKRALSPDDPKVQEQAERWYQELLVRNPEFKVEFKDVPAEENGFLLYYDLLEKLSPGEPYNATLHMEDDLGEMLAGKTAFDAEKLEKWIANNKELFQRILMIAEAPDQSVKGLPMESSIFTASRPATELSRLLQASARAAFEKGNPDEALRYHRASLNFANQLDGVEILNMFGSIFPVRFRMKSLANFHEHILPGLVDNPTALAKWRETLPETGDINDIAPRLLKNEWNLATRTSLLPSLISGPDPLVSEDQLPAISSAEKDAAVEAYTSLTKDHMNQASTQPFEKLIDGSSFPVRESPDLSEKGNRILHMRSIDPSNFIRLYGKQATFTAQHDALLAIALGEEPPPEPITGEPFVWDPETRTLSPPAALEEYKLDIKPLILPEAR